MRVQYLEIMNIEHRLQNTVETAICLVDNHPLNFELLEVLVKNENVKEMSNN